MFLLRLEVLNEGKTDYGRNVNANSNVTFNIRLVFGWVNGYNMDLGIVLKTHYFWGERTTFNVINKFKEIWVSGVNF